jgi:hypothetical protein
MKSRADQLLEGFKLGKLGAGSPRLTPETPDKPDHKSKIKIISQGFRKLPVGNEPDAPFICWRDPDGLTYYLELQRSHKGGSGYILYFCGGENLISPPSGGVENADFSSNFYDQLEYDKMLHIFSNRILPPIRQRGISAILNNPVIRRPEEYTPAFRAWLKQKNQK